MVTVTPAVAVRFWGSVIVSVQVPAPIEVTVTVEPLTLVVTTPAQPDATYGPAMASVTVRFCGLAVVASNVSVAAESEGPGTGVDETVGPGVYVDNGGVGVGVLAPLQAASSTRQATSGDQRTVRSLLAIVFV